MIDNSGSMEAAGGPDPLRLRGVAASLILDAAELASEVKAGLVFFADSATPYPLQEPDQIREKLQADRLPPAGGATNMQAALEAAFDLLRSSTVTTKRIVMITDGSPDDPSDPAAGTRQKEAIRTILVSRAVSSGIQIHALGLSRQVDETFLREITTPTGGRTLISGDHSQLLEQAKQLLAQRQLVWCTDDNYSCASRSPAGGG